MYYRFSYQDGQIRNVDCRSRADIENHLRIDHGGAVVFHGDEEVLLAWKHEADWLAGKEPVAAVKRVNPERPP